MQVGGSWLCSAFREIGRILQEIALCVIMLTSKSHSSEEIYHWGNLPKICAVESSFKQAASDSECYVAQDGNKAQGVRRR